MSVIAQKPEEASCGRASTVVVGDDVMLSRHSQGAEPSGQGTGREWFTTLSGHDEEWQIDGTRDVSLSVKRWRAHVDHGDVGGFEPVSQPLRLYDNRGVHLPLRVQHV
jgi:hypothetical protein